MARRKKKEEGSSAAWLVTFSDLMTLLLTFFVLLLSMASMDHTVITRINAPTRNVSPIPVSGPGQLQQRLELIVSILKDPENILEKQDRLKDLLFPDDVLPPELSPGELKENLSILQHPEGVVIVLTDGLLFDEGSAKLHATGKKLLDALTPVIHTVNADTNLSGHTDAGGRDGSNPYELSYLRAALALEHFLQQQISPDRFSVSGYGPDKAMFDNADAEGRRKNRRVEILIKTTPRSGSYI
ncbi:OmpA family protein [Desulfovibrio sp. OttesenSCG-928-M16]|nr:OmpA family protein [Desulfovibrio sp. OttesenSCG-928-M16]